MRRTLALSCCVLYLVFGVIAGAAHVHRAAGHHDEMRGLHLDHAHLGDTVDHGPDGHHQRERSGTDEIRVDGRRVAHHDGDTLYLNVPAHRLLDPGLRVIPAMVVRAKTIDAPTCVSLRRDESWDPLRGPPGEGPVPARAPPA